MRQAGTCGAATIGAAIWALAPVPAGAQTIEQLRSMSISELANLEVSSVSKSAQSLADAPAAIFVITRDMILGSGATTIPEILRLAPNLQVYRKNAAEYVITARGLNGNTEAQNFSNKLLVLIDGRSVYTPLYSGVYWDMQDVLPQNIERIEVISGPGATLWGANAVNGVINIITRDASQSPGALLTAQGGGREQSAGVRFSGSASPDLDWRVTLHANRSDETYLASGAGAGDDWRRLQGSARLDWAPRPQDSLTAQASLYGGSRGQLNADREDAFGGHVLLGWTHAADNGNALQVKAYYDNTGRRDHQQGGYFHVSTLDLDAQHTLRPVESLQLVYGGDLRMSRYTIDGGNSGLSFEPAKRTLWLASLFAHATYDLSSRLQFAAGLKLEDDPYAGISVLPDVRLSWHPGDGIMLWGGVSYAVRSPTPFDTDVQERVAGELLLYGNPDFRTEKLTAFQLGGRFQPADVLSFSISGYVSRYKDLRSIEVSDSFFPLYWGNELEGTSYGVEIWGTLRPLFWWTLSASLDLLGNDYRFEPGASGLFGTAQLGSDPEAEASLQSSMTLGNFTLDAHLRHMGSLPDPYLPAYTELNARIGYSIAPGLHVSIAGRNLLHERHVEYPGANALPRQVQLGLAWAL